MQQKLIVSFRQYVLALKKRWRHVLALCCIILIVTAPLVRSRNATQVGAATYTVQWDTQAHWQNNGASNGNFTGSTTISNLDVSSIPGDVFLAQVWGDGNYGYRQTLTLTNNSAATISSGTPVTLAINTQSLSGTSLQTDCDDLRVFYSANANSFTEITRAYQIASGATNCSDSTETLVTFNLQADIAAAGNSSAYSIYYGYGSATSPANPENAFGVDGNNPALVLSMNGTAASLEATPESPVTNTYTSFSSGKPIENNGTTPQGILINAPVTNLITNPSFEHTTFDNSWLSTETSDTIRVSSSSDDATQNGTAINLTNSTVRVGESFGDDYFGLRFQSVNLPQSAQISDAYISLITSTSGDGDWGSVTYTIYAEDVDNANTFSSSTNNISNRISTTASQTWTFNSQSTSAQTWYNTPSLTNVVQELVDRSGWSSNNSMAFIIQPTSGYGSEIWFTNDQGSCCDPAINVRPQLTVSYINPTASQELTTTYLGSSAAQLQSGNSAGSFYTAITAATTNTHALSAYVYDNTAGNQGGTVDGTIASLYWGGGAVSTSYENVGSGWYRLTGTFTPGSTGSHNVGVTVAGNKTIFLDAVQAEEAGAASPYVDGDQGSGYSWSGTAHDSTSSLSGSTLTYANTGNLSASAGTISFWVSPNWDGDVTTERNFFDAQTSAGRLRIYKNTSNNLVFTDGTNSSSTSISGWTSGSWYHVAATWGNGNIELFVNGTSATAAGAFVTPTLGSNFYLGANNSGSNQAAAVITDMRIYSSALSAGLIADIYNSPGVSHSSGSETPRAAESGTITNLKVDALGDASWTNIVWTESTTGDGDVRARIRTATTEGGLTGATWSGYYTNPAGNSITVDLNQYSEIELELLSPTGAGTATVEDLTLTYAINAAPDFQTVSASQQADGTVLFTYEIRDIDTTEGSFIPNQVDVTSIEYSLDGTNWSTASAVSGTGSTGLISVAEGTYTTYNVTWDADSEIPETYDTQVYLRVNVDDREAAFNTATGTTAAFAVDTKDPESSNIAFSARTDTLTLASTDDNALTMRLSNNSNLSADGTNGDSGSYIAYTTSKSWTGVAVNGIYTVYGAFRDAFSNTTSILAAITPATPTNLSLQDITDADQQNPILFLSWSVIDDPTYGFASYNIFRSTDNTNFSLLGTSNSRTTNYYIDNTVSVGTTYYYRVTATDNNGSESEWSAGSGGLEPTGAGALQPPPSISNVVVSNVTTNSATITWDTDVVATSTVGYSTDTNYGTEIGSPSYTTSHSMSLTGLTAETTYYFQVLSRDARNNTGSSTDSATQNFTTLADTTPPVISNLTAVATSDQAAVTWTTDEPANSLVEYGASVSLGSATTLDTDLVQGHAVTLTNLTPDTTYYYRVKSADAKSNQATSDTQTFTTTETTTDITAPTISSISVSNITSTGAIISFTTNEAAHGLIEYGETTSYDRGENNGIATTKTSHSINLYNLPPATTINYRVVARDDSGNRGLSANATFTTLADDTQELAITETGSTQLASGTADDAANQDTPEIVSNGATVTQITASTAVVSWETDKATSSEVLYQVQGTTKVLRTGSNTLTKNHSISLNGLKPATTYEFQVRSKDVNNNIVTSNKQEFATVSQPEISDVTISDITFTSARVNWSTNVDTDSTIIFGTARGGPYPNQETDSTLTSNHELVLAELTPNTTYFLQILGITDDGLVISSDEYSFKTKAAPDIFDVVITDLTRYEATINWKSSSPTASELIYINTNDQSQKRLQNPQLTEDHTVELSNLFSGTRYLFTIIVSDDEGSIYESEQYSFTTISNDSPPVVSNIQNKTIFTDETQNETQTIISWKSDRPAVSYIEYKQGVIKDDPFEFMTEPETDHTTQHIQIIDGLKPNTVYQFQIISTDQEKKQATSEPFVILTPKKDVSVFDIIINNFEANFGWLRELRGN